MLALPPLALYIHIPWCVRKCPYCDFNSHETATLPEADYVACLLADLEQELPWVQGRALQSVFFGGGTPSLFAAASIQAILDGVRARIPLADNVEITLEANPGTAEAARFAGYRAAGVNRLSIGVQSFQGRHLQALGRIHDSAQARQAVALARAAGFSRINLDLMHGLPGQVVEDALADLHEALALGVSHLSWYQLTIEPNTAFHRQPPPLPPDETLWAIQEAGQAVLQQAGLRQYEVSAYARPGEACRHNRNYWEFGDYLGIGAGAHGKVTLPAEGRILRYQKTRLPRDYQVPHSGIRAIAQPVGPADLPFEFLLNALRLVEGVPAALFTERTGLSLDCLQPLWQDLCRRGLVVDDATRLMTSPQGFLFLNDILTAFMPD